MKKTMNYLCLSVTYIIFLAAFCQPLLALDIGDKLPAKGAAVKMLSVDGSEVSIDSLAGAQGKLVIFFCNHCPCARAWEGRIVDIGNTYSKKGIAVIMVNSNDPGKVADESYDEMQKRAKDKGYQFPYVVDKDSLAALEFGAKKTPEAFLFDKDGKLVYHGAIDDNKKSPKDVKHPYLANALEAVLAGKKIAKADAEQPAAGCGIKFYKH